MDSLQQRIACIKLKFNEHNNTHPNVTNVWNSYLDIRVNRLVDTLNECDTLINKIDNGSPDISQSEIISLYNIYAILNNST